MLDDAPVTMEQIGTVESEIPVEISTRFLEQFSEQLYSSPQKAFEELISNSWDAAADFVDIKIPENLKDPKATITILDNGTSMGKRGLNDLWRIAFSPKEDSRMQHGRKMIGKFGIGKLATYMLANRLTYICKASDGIIRRVTMKYDEVKNSTESDRLVSDLKLELFVVDENELEKALSNVTHGEEIYSRLQKGNFRPSRDISLGEDEFGAEKSKLKDRPSGTWTLVILSGLKKTGQDLKLGILRRMLRAALPLSTEMVIQLNNQVLTSSKSDLEVMKEWQIGPDFPIQSIILKQDKDNPKHEILEIKSSNAPIPHMEIPEIGRVTGTVRLFRDQISGGKSEERGSSNGFYINVYGRVVNQNDPSFGEKNLNHAAWSRFRMSVRADGLDNYLTTNREQFQDQRSLKIFRSFLRQAFNEARSIYDGDNKAEFPDEGDVLVKSLGALPLTSLRSAVSETLKTEPPFPGLFDDAGIEDREKIREEWHQNTSENIREALNNAVFEDADDESFVKFRILNNSIVINKRHPFVAEHSKSREEKDLLRVIGTISFLSDIYALENGIEPEKLHQVREYRDRLMRFKAYQQRKSGINIAQILKHVGSTDSAELEAILADALRYIGWEVDAKGGSGEPDGIAKASLSTDDVIYSFTYDAKSAQSGTAVTGDLNLDGVNEHKQNYEADYALVVAPNFQAGAATTRAQLLGITLMKAVDLGKLLEITVELGAIPLNILEGIFKFHDPDEVSTWVSEIKEGLVDRRKFTIDVFMKAINEFRTKRGSGDIPGAVHHKLILHVCRNDLMLDEVTKEDVIAVAKGMSILVPDLVEYDDASGEVVINATSNRVAETVRIHLEELRNQP